MKASTSTQLARTPKSFSVASLLLQVRLLQVLLTLLTPFRSFVAWQLFCGRSLFSIARIFQSSLFKTLGWLSSRPGSKTLHRLLYPIFDLRRWHVVAAGIFLYSAISSTLRARRLRNDENEQQRRRLRAAMSSSRSYFEWSINASKLDALDGTDQEARWRQETRLYDRRLLEDKVAHLRSMRTSGVGVAGQMFAVRADLLRNLGNITNSALHEHFPVVPAAIRGYIDEVKDHLQAITCSSGISLEERTAFLKETRHAFGRTALVLFGGGSLGAFHLGVVKSLLEHRLLPRVLAGTCTGAIVAAIAATRDDEALTEFLASLPQMDLQFFSTGSVLGLLTSHVPRKTTATSTSSNPHNDALSANPTLSTSPPARKLRRLLGDVTFLQAYARTGRVLNVSVSSGDSAEPPRLLNYLTAPDVLVWSAVAAASGLVSGSVHPANLLAKDAQGNVVSFPMEASNSPKAKGAGAAGAAAAKSHRRWHQGAAAADDLPLRGLSETFSVNHILVSQTDPQLVPLLNLKRQMGTAGQLAEAELKHRCNQALEILPSRAPTRFLRRLAQPWEGDVTIVPPNALLQLRTSLVGPSQRDLLESVRAGELATWAKLSAIQCNCGIEAALDACIQQACAWGRMERCSRKPMKGAVVDADTSMSGSGVAVQAHMAEASPWAFQNNTSVTATPSSAAIAIKAVDNYYNQGIFQDIGAFSPTDAVLLLPCDEGACCMTHGGGDGTSGNSAGVKSTKRAAVLPREVRTPSPLFTPGSAFECTDSSANPFVVKDNNESDLAFAIDAADGDFGDQYYYDSFSNSAAALRVAGSGSGPSSNVASQRASLDVIAP